MQVILGQRYLIRPLFSVGSLITAIQQIINYGGYYFSGWRGAERVIVQLVLYALVTMAWILALKKDEIGYYGMDFGIEKRRK